MPIFKFHFDCSITHQPSVPNSPRESIGNHLPIAVSPFFYGHSRFVDHFGPNNARISVGGDHRSTSDIPRKNDPIVLDLFPRSPVHHDLCERLLPRRPEPKPNFTWRIASGTLERRGDFS